MKPFISAYLLVMGVVILLRVFRPKSQIPNPLPELGISGLGLAGGFFDAAGGGGWGPIVTTTLLVRGNHPRSTIGSVNLTEFAVTLAESATFALALGIIHWEVVGGLLVGGVVAAPFGAYFTKKIPVRTLMTVVGCLIIVLSLRTIILELF